MRAEIENVHMLPDGRSLINTHGGKRYRIVEKAVKDGYLTAKVEWIEDTPDENRDGM